MPSVPITRTPWGKTRPGTMGLKVEGEPIISMITTPVIITGTAGAWNIDEVERPGRKPVSQASAPGLRTVSFEHKVQSLNPYLSIEHLLEPFRRSAERGKRVQFIGGGWLVSGRWWWITSLSIAEDMKAKTHQTSRATLSWAGTEANTVSAVQLSKTGVKRGTLTVVRR